MSFQAKRYFKKILNWAGFFFFALALYMIYNQLSKYEFSDIMGALSDIPKESLILACLASLFGYVALSLYDFLALKYVKRSLAPWKWIMTGVIGFAISNNAGHAILSGGTLRYRFYTRWRFRASEIIKMVTFSGFTYLWACFGLIILGYFLTPDHAFGDGSASHLTTLLVTIGSALGLLFYFGAVLFYKKTIVIKEVDFEMPSFRMAISQVIIGGADIVLASLVLYSVLIPFVDIPFAEFIGVFLVAQVLGVFSQVPGGLGVFEGLFLYIIPGDHNKAYLLGALIAYRIIYYLLPLVIAGIILFIYEGGLKRRYEAIKAAAKRKKEKLLKKEL